ncbi:MAG: ATP-binding protein, partial [Nanoarchaeota archaeon]|nr:ATP-binding protein [Nanoarchaeota archaeon]
MKFKKADKKGSFLRMALAGPAGSGKSYTSLEVGRFLGKKVAAIDTERGSLSKYADKFDFDVMELENYKLTTYIEAIKLAEKEGYDVLIVDSLSHAWFGVGGALDAVEKVASRMKTPNSYTAWKEVTPLQNELINTILSVKCHVIVTMRTKTEYIMTTNSKGKMAPKKVGLAPIQRDGIDFEFDVFADMTLDNDLIITKTRCSPLQNETFSKPGKEFASILLEWLGEVEETKELQGVTAIDDTDFIDAKQSKDLWNLAVKTGYSKEASLKLLLEHKIGSFKEIPIEKHELLNYAHCMYPFVEYRRERPAR